MLGEWGGKQFSEVKAILTDLLVANLGPITAEMRKLLSDPASVDAVLADGAARARAIAEPVLAEAYDIVGFLKA